MPAASTPERLACRARDVRDLTGYSLPYVYRLIDTGQLPAIRVGRSVRILHDDLVAFLEAHRVGGDRDAR